MSLAHVKPQHVQILRRILSTHLRHLPLTAFVFGSRTGPTHRLASDVDLLLDSKTRIPLHTLAQLKEAFEESDLPFRVDVVLRSETHPAFYLRIRKDLTLLCKFTGNDAECHEDA